MINTLKKGIHRFAKSDSFDETDVSEDVARALFINEDYAIKRMKFESLRDICFQKLSLKKGTPSMRAMQHFFNNGASYIMDSANFSLSDKQEIDEYRNDNKLFMSIIQRIGKLTVSQKDIFLQKIEQEHNNIQANSHPLKIMDTILSSILTIK